MESPLKLTPTIRRVDENGNHNDAAAAPAPETPLSQVAHRRDLSSAPNDPRVNTLFGTLTETNHYVTSLAKVVGVHEQPFDSVDRQFMDALFSKLEKENSMVNPSGFGLPRPQAAAAAAAAPAPETPLSQVAHRRDLSSAPNDPRVNTLFGTLTETNHYVTSLAKVVGVHEQPFDSEPSDEDAERAHEQEHDGEPDEPELQMQDELEDDGIVRIVRRSLGWFWGQS